MRKTIEWDEDDYEVSARVHVDFDLYELMDKELDDTVLQEYYKDRFKIPAYREQASDTMYKEIAMDYLRYDFDLKQLIAEIGVDEVKKVVREMGGCSCGRG